MEIKRCDLNPVFVPYDLPLEDLETLGNYQPSELFGEIKCFNIPPYSLTVDKDKVKEMNLEPPDNKLFYMEFNIENNDKNNDMIKTEYIDINKCSQFEQIMLLLMSTLKEDDLREDIKECGFIPLGEIERFSRFGIDFQNIRCIQDLISLEDGDPRWELENKIQNVGKQMLELYEMLNDKIPANLEDCIKELDTQLSEDDKQFLIDNGALAVHHTLGSWIRNNWGLWKDSELKQNIQNLGYEHPDEMSNFIIEEYIKYLKTQNEASIGYN